MCARARAKQKSNFTNMEGAQEIKRNNARRTAYYCQLDNVFPNNFKSDIIIKDNIYVRGRILCNCARRKLYCVFSRSLFLSLVLIVRSFPLIRGN